MSGDNSNQYIAEPEKFINDLDFKNLFFKLFDYKWLILTFTLFGLILGVLYNFTIAPKYASTALIQVDGQLGSANNMQHILGNVGINLAAIDKSSPAEIEIALIKSAFILMSVVNQLKLNISTTPDYLPVIGSLVANLNNKNEIPTAPFGLKQWAWGHESIHLDTFDTDSAYLGRMFKLRFDGDNKYSLFYDGKFLFSGIIGELISTPLDIEPRVKIKVNKINSNMGTYFIITKKSIDDVILELTKNLSIIDLGDKNKSKTGVLQLTYQGSNPQAMPNILNAIITFAIKRNIEKKSAEASKTLDFLNKQLPTVKKNLNEVETTLHKYRAFSGTIDIAQESKIILSELSSLQQSIANLRIRKVEMLQELTQAHPFIQTISQKQLQLEREANDLIKKIRKLPHADQNAISLEREVKVKNHLYLLLLNSIQQLQVLKAGTLSDIRILSEASEPIIPLTKHTTLTTLIFMVIGFVISIIILIIRESFYSKVKNHEIIEDKLNIATFSIIPFCKMQKDISAKIKRKNRTFNPYVLTQMAPKDVTSEAFRSLRTMLQFHYQTASNNITCLLGATPHIGKSFTSVNLAFVLSELGKKVLFIDSDLRKGQIEQALAQTKSPGFAELLANPDLMHTTIRNINDHLDFIPSGQYPRNPSELLMADNTNLIIEKLSQLYDQVIIDTPPILAVTDAIILARKAGTNLLVVGGGSNELEELELTAKRAKKNGVTIHGLVFNHITPPKHKRENYRYYYAMD